MRERVRPQYQVIHEKNVPMKTRDGLTLYADIVRPDAPGRYPVLVSRTPYGKDTAMQNTDNSSFFFARIMPPRGPRRVLCVVVVTTSAYGTGLG